MTAHESSQRDGATVVAAAQPPPEPSGAPPEPRRAGRWRLGAIGLSGGLFSGLLGVGGGVVMVPLLVLWGNYSQRAAHAASLGAIVPISLAGVLTFGAAGEVRVTEAVALAAGAIVGAQAGARVLARARERTLKLGFGALLLVVAVLMAVGR